MENGESPEQAAIREVWEETGIQLDNFVSQGVIKWEAPEGIVDGIHVFLGE